MNIEEAQEIFRYCEISLEAQVKCLDYEPDHYVDSYRLTLVRVVDDEGDEIEPESIARMFVWLVRLSDALDDGVGFFDVFDAHSNQVASYFDSVGEYLDTVHGGYDRFVIHDLAVKPEYRGGKIGRMFINRACATFGRNCEFAVCQPRAGSSSDFIPQEWRVTKLSDEEICRYFASLGFRAVDGTGIYRKNLMEGVGPQVE